MIKLITQIRKWLLSECRKIYPELQIKQIIPLDNGDYYCFLHNQFEFSLILQDLKTEPKVSWVIHKDLTDDELAYWQNKYEVKLPNLDNYTKSLINIDNVKNDKPIKIIMSKRIRTMRIFVKDLKWILVMGREDPCAK